MKEYYNIAKMNTSALYTVSTAEQFRGTGSG
jgi:hypothetical protein